MWGKLILCLTGYFKAAKILFQKRTPLFFLPLLLLWLGGVLVGAVLGAIFYPITIWSVKAYRRTRGG